MFPITMPYRSFRRRVRRPLALLVLCLLLGATASGRAGNCSFYPYYWDGKTLYGFACDTGVDCGSCTTMKWQCMDQCDADHDSGYLTYDDWHYCRSTCSSDYHNCLCCVCVP